MIPVYTDAPAGVTDVYWSLYLAAAARRNVEALTPTAAIDVATDSVVPSAFGAACQLTLSSPQSDFDLDGIPDHCDPDDDNDGWPDPLDPAPYNAAVPGASPSVTPSVDLYA